MIQPLREQVLVTKIEESDRLEGGLHIPAGANRQLFKGKVVAVGTGPRYSYGVQDTDLKVGDIIYAAEGAGFDVRDDGVEYLLIPETSVVAVKRDA